MQPPTGRTRTQRASGPAPEPRGDEDELYRRHHRELERALSSVVKASPTLIEDACQTAWEQLLRHQPNRERVLAWLYVVARHEVYRLCEIDRRAECLESLVGSGAWETRIPDRSSLEARLDALEALRVLASLPGPQRRDVTLLIAGYSYHEIAQITGGRTYTHVKKHLAKARARIRLATPPTGGQNHAPTLFTNQMNRPARQPRSRQTSQR